MTYSIWVIILLIIIGFIYLIWINRERFKSLKIGKGASATPVLDSYSRNMTAEAKAGKLDPVIDRENEIERVTQILSRRTKNNPILLGKPGVGKTAIVEGLAQRITDKKVPSSLLDKRVLALNVSSIIAGTKYRGEFEQRLKRVMDEITTSNRTIILFIDEVHLVVQSKGAEGALDPADILKPALARGDMQAIGATTLNEYNKYIKPEVSLERRFQPVMVHPPDIPMTIKILDGLKKVYEDHHKVRITSKAIKAAAELSDKHIKDRYLPDKAIDLIDEASAMIRLQTIDAPDKIKELQEKLNEIKTQEKKAKAYEEMEQANRQEMELYEKMERLRLAYEEDKKGVKLPEVREQDIKEVLTEWIGKEI